MGCKSGAFLTSHNFEMLKLSTEDRAIHEANHFDVRVLRPYLIYLKEKQLGWLQCEECGAEKDSYDFHHKRYEIDVTFDDLSLLCESCHIKVTATNNENKKHALRVHHL